MRQANFAVLYIDQVNVKYRICLTQTDMNLTWINENVLILHTQPKNTKHTINLESLKYMYNTTFWNIDKLFHTY